MAQSCSSELYLQMKVQIAHLGPRRKKKSLPKELLVGSALHSSRS